jgi:threonine aldolase
VQAATALARRHGLSCHLDGARLFNAAVAQGLPPAQLAQPFDTVSVCLSKGLGAPVGSVLVGPKALIARARRWRKMLGGGMRQAGVLAAAGLYALEHNIERLAEDHANARRLAQGLAKLPGLTVTEPDTNIVFVNIDASVGPSFAAQLSQHGIGVVSMYGSTRQRWVTHLDVDDEAVDYALSVASHALQG